MHSEMLKLLEKDFKITYFKYVRHLEEKVDKMDEKMSMTKKET